MGVWKWGAHLDCDFKKEHIWLTTSMFIQTWLFFRLNCTMLPRYQRSMNNVRPAVHKGHWLVKLSNPRFSESNISQPKKNKCGDVSSVDIQKPPQVSQIVCFVGAVVWSLEFAPKEWLKPLMSNGQQKVNTCYPPKNMQAMWTHVPSGNQTWQWAIRYLEMMFPVPSYKPP